ncbi:MAG: type II toxin-antitoxin system RelE/ParE family toxin [Cyclobacteriaceae bacterium]
MIESFGCKDTHKIWEGQATRKWSGETIHKTLRKLFIIHAAIELKDLAIPPSNRLHKLKGDLKGFWSISVNDQWRLIFKWNDGMASEVQLVDYH